MKHICTFFLLALLLTACGPTTPTCPNGQAFVDGECRPMPLPQLELTRVAPTATPEVFETASAAFTEVAPTQTPSPKVEGFISFELVECFGPDDLIEKLGFQPAGEKLNLEERFGIPNGNLELNVDLTATISAEGLEPYVLKPKNGVQVLVQNLSLFIIMDCEGSLWFQSQPVDENPPPPGVGFDMSGSAFLIDPELANITPNP